MGKILNNLEEVANAFRRKAVAFKGVRNSWSTRHEQRPLLKCDPVDDAPKGIPDDADLDPTSKLARESVDAIMGISRTTESERARERLIAKQDQQILDEGVAIACYVGRLVRKIIERLDVPEHLRLEAEAINDRDNTAVYAYWSNEVVPAVLGQSNECDEGRPVPFTERFQQGAEACEAIANMLSSVQKTIVEPVPDLTLKGLANYTGLGTTSLQNAAKKANVTRPATGGHGYKYQPSDVYKIAWERMKRARYKDAEKKVWNKLLVRIDQPTLDDPRKAVRKRST